MSAVVCLISRIRGGLAEETAAETSESRGRGARDMYVYMLSRIYRYSLRLSERWE